MQADEPGATPQTQTGGLGEAMQQAVAASEAGDKETAYNLFREITMRYPDALEAWVWLGWTSPGLDEAEAAFQRACAINPTSEEAKLGLRWIASQREAREGAEQDVTRAEDATQDDASMPDTPPAQSRSSDTALSMEEQVQAGIAALEVGDKVAAHEMFGRIVDANPNATDAWVWLGGTTSDLQEAEAAFRRALELDPSNHEAALGLRWVDLRRQAQRQGLPSSREAAAPRAASDLGPEGGRQIRPYDSKELARQQAKQQKRRGFFDWLFGRR